MSPRRSRSEKSLKRPRPSIPSRDRVLIVTEGEKTEPIYFRSFCRYYRIPTADVVIEPSLSSCPLNLVDFAIELRIQNISDNKLNEEPLYDYVYCVFDRDEHARYYRAFDKANANQLSIIRSIPCFEIWLLLHFLFTTRMFTSREILREIRKYLPGYQKAHDNFQDLINEIDTALRNALRLYSDKEAIHVLTREHPNPFTEIHILAQKLISLGNI